MFDLELNITKKEWLSNPPERWNAGLDMAGINFRQHLQVGAYPPIPVDSRYTRKGNAGGVAGLANYRITEFGKVMEFGSTEYLKFLLMPSRTVEHWRGKKEELFTTMKEGFSFGIKNFTGA